MPSSSGVVKLEGPQEVAGVLEVGSDGEDLVNEVLDTDDAILAKVLLNDVVGRDWSSVTVHLDESALVDQLTNRLQVRSSPGDLRFADAQHVQGGLVQLDEHAVVDLAQTEQLKSFLHLGGDLVDTTDSHDEGELRVGGNIEITFLLSIALQLNLLSLLILVLLGVLLSLLEDLDPLCLLRRFRIVSGTAGSLGAISSFKVLYSSSVAW